MYPRDHILAVYPTAGCKNNLQFVPTISDPTLVLCLEPKLSNGTEDLTLSKSKNQNQNIIRILAIMDYFQI